MQNPVTEKWQSDDAAKGVPAGFKLTEVGVIPEDWDCVEIDSLISEISMGPFGSDIKVSNFVSEGVPVLNGVNVSTERLSDTFTNFVTESKAKSLKKAVAHRGDVVVTHRGTIGQISYIPENSIYTKYVISQSQFRVKFKPLVIPSWITSYFLSDEGAEKLLEGKGHTGVPALSAPTTTFRKLKVPLPSLGEQITINRVLLDIDIFIAEMENLITKKQAIKTATMQQLLTGKTRLPQFALREDGTVKGYKNSELGEIPEDWEVSNLGNIAKIQRGASPRPIDSPIWFKQNSSVGWLRISDVTKTSKYLTETTQNLSELGIASSRFVPSNSLVMSICATVGKPIITNKDICIHDGFVVFNYLNINQNYMYYILKDLEDEWMKEGQTGSQMNLNTRLINNRFIIFPNDNHEQTAIAAIFSDMDQEIQTLQQRLEKTRQIKQGMMQELLTGKTRLI
ncbi:restriction endonuclease subunit S [Pectobacterium polaris]|uniref:restriction endonuclease subunit S n=1 Tax=Pectobacterium polaris TaxID=2042057 RepID=UPI0015815675|nr:restriction endonuclease subunit S [Pectobacterium polaris]